MFCFMNAASARALQSVSTNVELLHVQMMDWRNQLNIAKRLNFAQYKAFFEST